ncbi:unnamed protein product [Diamesa hyperborea]
MENVEEESLLDLNIIYEIIRKFEKYNISDKNIESQECSQKIVELQKRLEAAREEVRQLPGIDESKNSQLERLENLKKQLKIKQELINKYKNFIL